MLTEIIAHASSIAAVVFISTAIAISPGTDFVIVTKNSLMFGRKPGFYTALGVSFGIWVHIAYSITGTTLLISSSPLLFSILKYLGAGYLIYLGVQTILRSRRVESVYTVHNTSISRFSAFKNGVVSNVLNPKTTLFFVSLFTQLRILLNVNTDSGPS